MSTDQTRPTDDQSGSRAHVQDDAVAAACAWSDFRREYGVSANDGIREREHRAFVAGFRAAGGTADLDGVLR